MMQAIAALLYISPALFMGLWLCFVLTATTVGYGIEAAWLALSRTVLMRAAERAPTHTGLHVWLTDCRGLWIALYAVRSTLWASLAAMAMLRWLPWLSAVMGTRGPVLWVPALLTTALLALGCRVLGQSLGRKHTAGLGLFGMGVLWPLTYVAALVVPLLRRLPSSHDGDHDAPFWTADALVHTVRHSHQEHLGDRGIDLFASLSEFSDTVIREIMVPRTEVVSLSSLATQSEVYAQLLEAGHSRMPVYEETIDHVIGVLHVKDLFAAQLTGQGTATAFDINALLRPCFYVPEMMQISLLLQEFQRRKTHLAIVVDEYGGTAGVVTLEDIIEEIVGEIQDEYDVEAKQFRVLGEGRVLADARVNLWDLEQALGVSFPADGGYETLAGFLMAITGHLPQRGAQVAYKNLRFTIKDGNERRIGMVDIERIGRSAVGGKRLT